ncbi:hypothetical protein [Clostridium sp. AT4]|uniref:hypothetical protein n=1 Tax=Clostridium sp. AT4 TaxID=1720194 RepID=UPI00082BDCAE|nr:hypothetical protein [Clostridium sp. AT4]
MRIRLNRLILTTGALLCLTAAPIAQTNPLGTMEVQAAELPYSIYWETQADGNWKYKLNTGGYASGWIQDEVDKNWYYMDESATMQSGVYKSNGKYYLLSELHDGHYGHMVKNGEVYQGITISASTNADDEGALTDSTLSALRNAGVNVDNVPDISGSQHVKDGEITSPSPAPQPSQPDQSSHSAQAHADAFMDKWFGGPNGPLDKGGTGAKGHLYN